MRAGTIIAMVVLLVLPILKGDAQTESPVRFGVRAGINFSNLKLTAGPETGRGGSWKAGFNFGGLMVVPFAKKLSVQPEYLFSEIGGEVEGTDKEYIFQYLSLPVFLRWQLTRNLPDGRATVRSADKC